MRAVLALFFAAASVLGQTPPPRTVPEVSGFAHTSRVEDVVKFVASLRQLPHGDRLTVGSAGVSHEGRDMQVVKCALPGDGKQRLRALVIANIHAGEVEGKESVQVLLREFANGEHEALLQHFELHFVPVYNLDGNERIDVKNRPEQNGPDGVGQRPNASNLDLNRDFVKAEAEETRALLSLFNRLDPHVFMDLHTTNGSYHGYALTFAPCLSTGQDPALSALTRTLLDEATAAMQKQDLPIFDYGNFETRDWDGSGAPESQKGVRGWYSYDHRARYGINYYGLRNRIAVLSEAYSYRDFQTRIAATRAFVLAVLTAAAAHRDVVASTCAAADAAVVAGQAGAALGWNTTFAPPEQLEILVADVDKVKLPDNLGVRLVHKADSVHKESMPVCRAFKSKEHADFPFAWALPSPPPDVIALLTLHGVQHEVLAAARPVAARTFTVTGKRKPKRPFQGHQELMLDGEWQQPAAISLPQGTLWIPARQPLGRLAAQLLEPKSEDSLSTWNMLEALTAEHFPVLRIEPPR
jgi:hypothetical protein